MFRLSNFSHISGTPALLISYKLVSKTVDLGV